MVFVFALCNSYLSFSRLYRRMRCVVFFIEKINMTFCTQVKNNQAVDKLIFR